MLMSKGVFISVTSFMNDPQGQNCCLSGQNQYLELFRTPNVLKPLHHDTLLEEFVLDDDLFQVWIDLRDNLDHPVEQFPVKEQDWLKPVSSLLLSVIDCDNYQWHCLSC